MADGRDKDTSALTTSVDSTRDVISSSMRDTFDDLRSNGSQSSALHLMERRLRGLHQMIGDVIRKQTEREEREVQHGRIEQEWRNVALVLDRLFFVCYLVGIIVSLMVLFPKAL